MKKVNNVYQLSNTEIAKISAHTRALARKYSGNYDGRVAAYFDHSTGEVIYEEFVGSGWLQGADLEEIYSAKVSM